MPKKKKQTADPAKRSNGRATSVIITAAGQTARARWEAIQSQAEAHQIVWLGEKVAAAALKEARAVQRRELEEQRRTLQLSLRETRPPGAGGTDGGGNGGAATPVLSQQAPEVRASHPSLRIPIPRDGSDRTCNARHAVTTLGEVRGELRSTASL